MKINSIPVFFNSLFQDVSFGVVIHELTGEIIYYNQMSETILGKSSEEMLGKKSTDDEWICFKEDGTVFNGEDHPAMYSLRTGLKQENVIMQVFNNKINSFKWIRIDSYPISDNNVAYILVIFKDITEDKANRIKAIKNETQFKALFQASQEGMALHKMVYDNLNEAIDYMILDVNPGFLKIMNCKKEDMIMKLSKEAYKVNESPYLDIYAKVVKDGEPTNFEVYFQPLEKYFNVSAVKYDTDHFATIFFDITSQKKDEKIIKEQIDLLRLKTEEMEQLNHSVSHDLRSPLLTIKGFSQQIEKDLKTLNYERIESSLEKINRASDKMQYLLEDMLKYSKSTRSIDQLIRINTEHLINDLIDMLQLQLLEKNAEIIIDTFLPDIYAEYNKIREIFQNLLENSLKFTYNTEHPIINIGYKDNTFYFKDNGIGIDEVYHDKIFMVFEKLDKNSYGSGIGLSIVKKIITNYNSKIWIVTDEHCPGACFKFTLPLYSLKNDIFPEDSKYPRFITRDSENTIQEIKDI